MKINYGIAVTSNRQLAELPELKRADFLELPSSCVQAPDFILPKAWQPRVFRVSSRSESRIFSAMIGSGTKMAVDFCRLFSRRCEDCAALGVREITLTVDWENLMTDPVYADRLREILRCCFGIVEKYRMTAVLELRIPGLIAGTPNEFLRFRNSLLFPVRTLVDLHPHEPGALEFLSSYAQAMPFDVSRFRISFDAVGGNYLTVGLLDKIRNVIRPVGGEVPQICFYPGRSADRAAFAALETVIP